MIVYYIYIYNLETPGEGDLLYFRAPLYFLIQPAVSFSQLYMALPVLCAVWVPLSLSVV